MPKVRDAIERIEEDGWYVVSQKGSHRQYKHPNKSGRVTIAGKLSGDLHPKTYRSILTQAQVEE
jgi:predicted RNA binding protein YcfA (HicA-like mRNA interferase family)